MTENYLEIHKVKKSFTDFTLNDIAFSLPKGYIMGLVGSNGAGKTTTIKLILNMLEKDQGKIDIFGYDSVENEKEIKQHIGFVSDKNFFVDSWTVKEIEKAISVFYDEWDHKIFQEMLQKFGLTDHIKIGNFSRGMQIKLMLACAFSHNAKLLILDEPTSGLDAAARSEFLEILQDYIKDGEKSVLFSTHITTDLEQVADYITYIERGELIFTGSMDELLQKYVVIKGAVNEITDELKNNILGIRQTNVGFEGLIGAEIGRKYKNKYILDNPTIDEIIIHINKEGR